MCSFEHKTYQVSIKKNLSLHTTEKTIYVSIVCVRSVVQNKNKIYRSFNQ